MSCGFPCGSPGFFLGGYWECKPFFPKEKTNTMAGKVTFVDLWR